MLGVVLLSLLMGWLYVLIITLYSWYIQWARKKNRKPQNFGRILKTAPMRLPLLGHIYLFRGGNDKIFDTLKLIYDARPSIWKGYLGNQICYGIAKPEYLESILNNRKALEKGVMYQNFFADIIGDGLITGPVKIWKKNRKIVSPTFNQKILDTFVPTFEDRSKIYVERLKERIGEEFCVFQLTGNCTLDAVCNTTMGFKVDSQLKDCYFSKYLERAMTILWYRIFKPLYYINFTFKLLPIYKIYRHDADYIKKTVDEIVKAKRIKYEERVRSAETFEEQNSKEKFSKCKPFLDLLLEMEGVHMNDKELRDESITLAVAGSDTTAAHISFALIMLGMHPEMQEKVYQEVIEVTGNGPMHYKDLSRLEYTERFLKETLRLFPPGSIIVRKIDEPITVGEYTLEAPSMLVLGLLYVQRNPKYWPNPLKFDPDRFLPDECAKRSPYTFLPFSAGPRNCIGSKYSMMVVKVIVANVLKEFTIKTPYKSVEEIKLRQSILLRPQNGFLCSFHKRAPI